MNKLFYLLFFMNIMSYGQTKECVLLEELMNSGKISKFFYVKKDSIVIIDRPRTLFECQDNFIKPIISYNQDYMEITPETRGSIMNNKNIIILYRSESVKKRQVIMYFWQPYSGANLIVSSKINSKNNKVKKISYREGAF